MYTSTSGRSSSSEGGTREEEETLVDSSAPEAAGGDDFSENFKVVIRVRPPVARELEGHAPYMTAVRLSAESPRSITLCDALNTEDGAAPTVYAHQSFTFDYVYGESAQQVEVYERSARPAVLSMLGGYNATLMAYGQTGTGKTYTMEGYTDKGARGIIPRAIEELFEHIASCRDGRKTRFLVRASFMQIYREVIMDLLQQPPPALGGGSGERRAAAPPLVVRHTPQRGVYVEGLSEWIVRTPDDVYGLIERGTALRATSSTRMSEFSSRSHAVFTVSVEVVEGGAESPHSYRLGKLNIVDLAGSEKIRQAGVTGQRLEETKKINKSLHELGNVIAALATPAPAGGRARHIPFRNSVLTSVLRDSLGGNCKTTLIACISPALESYAESLSTLVFANRAKNIRNRAVINSVDGGPTALLLRRYEQELKQLRQLLQEGGGRRPSSDEEQTRVVELEENKRRAEEDREVALAALKRSSAAHVAAERTRLQLEHRIAELEVLLEEGSGGGPWGTPRSSEEEGGGGEEAVQAGRYKHLLLRQRDIMLGLTRRLNERDEDILHLQEEVDAYDTQVQILEERLALLGGGGGGGAALGVSQAQAEDYVRRCRLDTTEAPPRYRSTLNPGVALSADKKLVEVLMLGAAAAVSVAPRATVGIQSLVSQAELVMLQEKLQNMAEDVARSKFAEQLDCLRTHLEAVCMQLAAKTSCCQILERAFDARVGVNLEKLRGAEARGLCNTEATTRQQHLLDEVAREGEARRQLLREVNRQRFELSRLMEAVQLTPTQQAAASRLWQSFQALADGVVVLGCGSVAELESHLASLPQTQGKMLESAMAEKERTWQGVLRSQCEELCELKQRLERGPPGAEALARELETYKKDHRALQVIMEQRIKVKVDGICAELARGLDDGGPLSAKVAKKALGDAKSLQNLVSAAIDAMRMN